MGGGGKGGGSSYSERPLTANELRLVDSQAKYNNLLGQIAQESNARSAQTQADWERYYRPVEIGNTDPNTGLYAATIAANDSNQQALNGFLNGSKANADMYNLGNGALSGEYARRIMDNASRYGADALSNAQGTANTINQYSNEYNNFMGGINNATGTADAGVLARLRADNTSGLSTANNAASRSLQAQLAQRGLLNSGVGAKSMADLNTEYMRQLGGANANAYGQAINQSDSMRMNQVGLNNQRLQGMIGAAQAGGQAMGDAIDKNYNAQQGSLNTGYGAKGNALNSAYNTNNAQQGAALNAISSANQQRIGNLTNFSQLGRGMAGLSQNYLGQAGQMYGSAAQNAGQMFGNMGQLNNSYNQAQAQQSGAKGSGVGQLAGTLGSAYIMSGSDARLKDNIVKIGTVGELNLYTWDWNDEAKRIGADAFPNIGVIAQEAQEVYPEVVGEMNGYLAVNYGLLIDMAKGD